MDDVQFDFSDLELYFSPNVDGEIPSSCSVDSFLGVPFADTHFCSHTHTCNSPGPDRSHTHTCFHVHGKIVPSPTEDKAATDDTAATPEKKLKKGPLGNRESVRKYREKKKAQDASLKGEVGRLGVQNQQLSAQNQQLRAKNQQLLQGQAVLEAENARLKCLFVDIRGRIEGEVGTFPYQKTVSSTMPNPSMFGAQAYVMNPCNVQFEEQVNCLQPDVDGKCGDGVALNDQGFSGCEFERLQCLADQNSGKDFPGCGLPNVAANVNSFGTGKGKTSLCLYRKNLV